MTDRLLWVATVVEILSLVLIIVLLGGIYQESKRTTAILWLQFTLMDDTTYEEYEIERANIQNSFRDHHSTDGHYRTSDDGR